MLFSDLLNLLKLVKSARTGKVFHRLTTLLLKKTFSNAIKTELLDYDIFVTQLCSKVVEVSFVLNAVRRFAVPRASAHPVQTNLKLLHSKAYRDS